MTRLFRPQEDPLRSMGARAVFSNLARSPQRGALPHDEERLRPSLGLPGILIQKYASMKSASTIYFTPGGEYPVILFLGRRGISCRTAGRTSVSFLMV